MLIKFISFVPLVHVCIIGLKLWILIFTHRSLRQVSSPPLWPPWLPPWKISTARMKSVTRPPTRTPARSRRRTLWPLHTGIPHAATCYLSHVLHRADLISENIFTRIFFFHLLFICSSDIRFFFFFSVFTLSERLCMSMSAKKSELSRFTAAFSCFFPPGISLRLVGSALSDSDVLTTATLWLL